MFVKTVQAFVQASSSSAMPISSKQIHDALPDVSTYVDLVGSQACGPGSSSTEGVHTSSCQHCSVINLRGLSKVLHRAFTALNTRIGTQQLRS